MKQTKNFESKTTLWSQVTIEKQRIYRGFISFISLKRSQNYDKWMRKTDSTKIKLKQNQRIKVGEKKEPQQKSPFIFCTCTTTKPNRLGKAHCMIFVPFLKNDLKWIPIMRNGQGNH